MQTQHPAVKNVIRVILRHPDKFINDLNLKIGHTLTISKAEEIIKSTEPEKLPLFNDLIIQSDTIEGMIRGLIAANLPIAVGISLRYWAGEFVVDAIKYDFIFTDGDVLVARFYLHEL